MLKKINLRKAAHILCAIAITIALIGAMPMETYAVSFPSIGLNFEPSDESVVVSGVPASDASGSVEYQLEGYLNYGSERIETFCYGPKVVPYDVPSNQAYIFNWAGNEFILPCSGQYTFTAYITARYIDSNGNGVEEKGPKQTITITLNKKDTSTNWGPGLPSTTVETYDLKQLKGKDKDIVIEENGYTWTINGTDIQEVPEKNISLMITSSKNEESMKPVENDNTDNFFGETFVEKINIEHNGAFGFKAVLDYNVGTEYTGKYMNLFYVEGSDTFTFMEGCLVDESGIASFTFDHASDYVLAATDEEYTGQELNATIEEPVEEEMDIATPPVEEEEEKAGVPVGLIIGGAVLVLVAAGVVVRGRKKAK